MNTGRPATGRMSAFENGRGSSSEIVEAANRPNVVERRSTNRNTTSSRTPRARMAGAPGRQQTAPSRRRPRGAAVIAGLIAGNRLRTGGWKACGAGRVAAAGGPVFGVVRVHESSGSLSPKRPEPHMTTPLGRTPSSDRNSDADGKPASHAQTNPQSGRRGRGSPNRLPWTSSGSGEHHTDDFPIAGGDVVLAAISAATR